MMTASQGAPPPEPERQPVATPSYRAPRFRRTPYLTGLLLVLVSGITFGTLPIFVRYAYADGATPVTVLVLRFALAGTSLLTLTLVQRRTLPSARRLLGLIALGGLGYGGQSFCYFTALTLAPVSLVTMLLYTFPAMVVGLSVAMGLEHMDLRRSTALVLALGLNATVGVALGAAQEPPRGPADVLTGPGSNPRSTPEAALAAPSIGMRQLAGEALPLAVAGLMEGVPVGSVEVHVRDFRNQPAVEALLRLGVMGQDQARSSHEARTDANGVAVFRDLPTGDAQAYRVNLVDEGAVTSTTPFRLPAEAGYRVEIMRLPITEDTRMLFVWQYDTSIEFIAGKLHIVQQMQLLNGGDSIIRLPEEGLRFSLPEDIRGFQSQATMSDQRIEPGDGVFLLKGSIPPGGQTLLYGYDVPITPGTMRLAVGVPLRVRTVQVVSKEAPGIDLRVSGLPEPRIHEAATRLLVTGIQRDATEGPLGELVITLDNIPGPGPARLIAVSLAVLLLLVGGFFMTSKRDPSQLLSDARDAQRDDLLDQLTTLEAQHAAGDVGPEFYARERATLRDALALWVKQGGASPAKAS